MQYAHVQGAERLSDWGEAGSEHIVSLSPTIPARNVDVVVTDAAYLARVEESLGDHADEVQLVVFGAKSDMRHRSNLHVVDIHDVARLTALLT